MKVTLMDITPDAEDKIATYAGVCYDADTSPGANERRVKKLMSLKCQRKILSQSRQVTKSEPDPYQLSDQGRKAV